jgi:3-oxoacyl-[acyl-carrier protein] reductase
MIDPGLHNKVVLITGGNSGIGAATAKAFAAQDAKIVLHYLENTDQKFEPGARVEHTAPGISAAEEVATDIKKAGGQIVLVKGNLLDPSTASVIFNEAENKLGPVDILINNAAHCESPDTILDIHAGSIDRHFAVNARSPVLLMHEYAQRYKRRGGSDGRIINLSTDAARAFATQIGYGASKAALEAFTRSVAFELGPLGITVNAVAPGPVQTGWMSPDLEHQIVESIPLRRVGTPEDIADAIVFLASYQARWISGQVIQVAGGHAL